MNWPGKKNNPQIEEVFSKYKNEIITNDYRRDCYKSEDLFRDLVLYANVEPQYAYENIQEIHNHIYGEAKNFAVALHIEKEFYESLCQAIVPKSKIDLQKFGKFYYQLQQQKHYQPIVTEKQPNQIEKIENICHKYERLVKNSSSVKELGYNPEDLFLDLVTEAKIKPEYVFDKLESFQLIIKDKDIIRPEYCQKLYNDAINSSRNLDIVKRSDLIRYLYTIVKNDFNPKNYNPHIQYSAEETYKEMTKACDLPKMLAEYENDPTYPDDLLLQPQAKLLINLTTKACLEPKMVYENLSTFMEISESNLSPKEKYRIFQQNDMYSFSNKQVDYNEIYSYYKKVIPSSQIKENENRGRKH